MKTSRFAALAAAFLLGALSPEVRAQGQNLTVPVGNITAFPTIVHTGTHPTLTWEINYPSIVQDFVEVVPPATLVTKANVDMDVRVIGAGVTVEYTNGTWAFVPTEAQLKYHTESSYGRIFYGTNLQVNPNTKVYTRTNIPAGRQIRFGGRYYFNNAWGPHFTSQSGTNNIRTLVNGEIPPTLTPMNGPSLEEFVRPYLDDSGRVKIGPMDVIVFMELTHHDNQMSDPGYDLQDMVLLVTFKKR